MAVAQLAQTLGANGFTPWQRYANAVQLLSTDSTETAVQKIGVACDEGRALEYAVDAVWNNFPSVAFDRPIPQATPFLEASNTSPQWNHPRFNFASDATHGFDFQFLGRFPPADYGGFFFTGARLDGSAAHPAHGRDGYRIRFNSNPGSGYPANQIVVEDVIAHDWSHPYRWVDDGPRTSNQAHGTPGGLPFIARRLVGYNAHSDGDKTVTMYIEGAATGSLVEQSYFAYAGFTAATGRDALALELDGDLESDKQEHGIYFQTLNGMIIVRFCTYYECPSFMFQMRPGGDALYNFGYSCGNPIYGGRNNTRIIGNVIGKMVDISADQGSGKGYGCFGGVPVGEFRENLGYDNQGTVRSGQATNDVGTFIYASAGQLIIFDNVAWDWKKQLPGHPYSLFANDVLYDMAPGHASHAYDGAVYDLDAPANYDDYPKIDAADHAQLIGRKLGEWRPDIDHPGAKINVVRQKAYDGVLAKYGVGLLALQPKTWEHNVATPPGLSGLTGETAPEPNQLPTVNAGADQSLNAGVTTATLTATAGDADGAVVATAWELVTGPSVPTIVSPSSISTDVNGLVTGTYVFRCTVTDDDGGVSFDEVAVTINPAASTSATINSGELLADFQSRIQTALVDHGGAIALEGAGAMPTSEIDVDQNVVVTADANAFVLGLPESPVNYNDSARATVGFRAGGSGTWDGGIIDANGAYAAVATFSGSDPVGLSNIDARNASYKCFAIRGSAALVNCRASSNVSGGDRRSSGLLIDPGSTPANLVTVDGFVFGSFVGSTEGQMTKVAAVKVCRLTNIRTPMIDADTVYSLVVGESVGYLLARQVDLPRQVSHFPDALKGVEDAEVVIFDNCDFGNYMSPPHTIHDRIRARIVIYRNCRFRNVQAKCFDDETPAANLVARIIIGCDFETSGTDVPLFSHADGIGTLAGKIQQAKNTFSGSGTFSKPSDWDASEVTLPVGYNLEKIAEALL